MKELHPCDKAYTMGYRDGVKDTTPETDMKKQESWEKKFDEFYHSFREDVTGHRYAEFKSFIKDLQTARDTYWKEMVVAIINDMDAPEGAWREALTGFKQVLISAIKDNLK